MNPDIEQEYAKMMNWYENSRKKKNETGIESVLQFLVDHPEKIWWWSWEFIGQVNSKGGWLSHRSPARASDLAIHHPHLVEDRKIGRFKIYRLRTEHMDQVNKFLNIGEYTPKKQSVRIIDMPDGTRKAIEIYD